MLLVLETPPAFVPRSHRDYLPWLEYWCYDRVCVYCTEHARVLEIDHVEPESLAPQRKKDPTNLLPACATCNGPTGKWDYHPARVPRKKCPHDDHGHRSLDPRVDDYAHLYEVRADGGLEVCPCQEHDRALWNRDVLFRLNRPKLRQWRKQAQDLALVAEQLVRVVAEQGFAAAPEAIRRRNIMVREIAQRLLFFELFELPLSDELRSQAEAMRASARRDRTQLP